MIVSAFNGRIRFVEPGLKNKNQADVVENRLKEVEGITSVRITPAIGSLLISFDSSVAGVRSMIREVEKNLKQSGARPAQGTVTSPRARRYVKYGLMGSLTGSLGFLVLDSEKWHYRMGTAFLSMLSLHLVQNRKRLLK